MTKDRFVALLKTKTFWTGIAAIASGVGMWHAGSHDAAVQTIIGGVAVICIRDGMTKGKSNDAQN